MIAWSIRKGRCSGICAAARKGQMRMNIAVYLGSFPGNDPVYEQKVKELGDWIGRSGNRLVYGGSKVGLMGRLAESALDAGGYVIGVEPGFFVESCLQLDGIQELIVTKTMAERRLKIIELSDAFIAFPGGTGTLEEVSEVMSRLSIGLTKSPCILYNLNGYYDHLRAQLDLMVKEGFLPEENRKKVSFAGSLDEIIEILDRNDAH